MAEKIVKGTDIVQQGALTEHINQVKLLTAEYDALDKEVASVVKNIRDASKGYKATNAGDTAKAVNDEKLMTLALINQEKVKQARLRTMKLEEQQAKRTTKAINDETNAYTKQSKELNTLRNQYKNLAAQNKANTKEARDLLKEITKLDSKLKGIDKTVGQSQRNVGNYTSALGRLRGVGLGVTNMLGKLGLAMGVGAIVRNVTKIFFDFNQEVANLASVLGKTTSEIEPLINDAKRLGASTKFTASEVVQLQVAFSKLGFKEEEILSATEATLELAAATGVDLATSAEIAASVLNGFGLGAEQTQRVVDVMAKSFTSSALDMEKFQVAMRAVGPVAKTAGFSIERTTAMIGVLADNGVRAETAGTGLRNVFLELSKRGITFEQAMKKIANSSDKAATSMELFGKENAVVGVVLSENVEKTNNLEKALMNAGGAAEQMANTQLDTLSGATTLLSSAWEGFILSLEDGDGIISRVLTGAINLATDFLNILTRINETAGAKEGRVLTAAKGGGEKGAQGIIKEIKALEELSNAELELMAKENKQASLILKLRKDGISELERQAIVYGSMIRMYQEQIDLEKKSGKNGFGVFSSQTQQNISGFTGAMETFNAEIQKTFSLMSNEDLTNFIEKSQKSSSSYAKTVAAMAKLELARRNDAKGTLDIQEGINSELGKTSKELSEMAKLEAKLQAIQLERSNLIIQQKGNESDRTLELKIQERELQKQIDRYKEIIEQANKLERVAPREPNAIGGRMTTQEQADKMAEQAQREYEYYLDQKKEKEEKHVQEIIQLSEDLTDITTFLIDRRIEAIDREIEAEKRKEEAAKQNIDAIIAMRQLDSNSLAQSIAFEKQQQAQALAEQEKLQKKKQRLELFNTAVELLNSEIAAGNGNPLGKTMSDITALMGFIRSIPGFYEGTDTTVGDAVGMKVHRGKDGILSFLDKEEMVLNPRKTKALASMGVTSTDEILRRVQLSSMGVRGINVQPPMVIDNSEMVAKLDEHSHLLKQLVNKPVTETTMEQMGNVMSIIEKVRQPRKTVVTVKRKRIS